MGVRIIMLDLLWGSRLDFFYYFLVRGSSVQLAKVFIFAYGVFLNCTTAEAGNGPIPYPG